jgi:HAT1-interacting factor 1
MTDMITQLVDLKAPPSDSVKDALYGPTSGVNPLGGILGATIGEAPADAAARIEEATKNATDLSGLIRHKKKPKPAEATTIEQNDNTNGANGKRKAEDDAEDSDSAKKAKVESAAED